MYLPRAFVEDDVPTLVSIARTAGFGHLTLASSDGLVSTPIPFVIADDGSWVRGHLARPNSMWRAAPCRALLIVPVSDAYVSPSWYPSKAEHGRAVPTWNYEVVHLHGELVAHDDAMWVAAHVRQLSDTNEAGFEDPWSVDDAPRDYIEQMLRGIVGLELSVDRLEGKRKLGQNRSEADRAGTIAGLEQHAGRGAAAIAAAMRSVTPLA